MADDLARSQLQRLGEFIREQRKQAELSLRELADRTNVSNPYLSQIERGLRKPSVEILQQIARGLAISAETLYERAGILDRRDRPASPDVVAAIEAADDLDPRQKHALIEVYRSMRRSSAGTSAAVETDREAGGTDGGQLADR